jgi:uncharacterized membrane protein YcjF (UPF0283 family)
MKLLTTLLLLLPPLFMAVGVLVHSQLSFFLFAALAFLCSLACLAWGIRILQSQGWLAWVCIGLAALYLIVVSLSLIPAKSHVRRKQPNQSLQATPTNASVSSLKLRAGLCDRFGVPELYRYVSGLACGAFAWNTVG